MTIITPNSISGINSITAQSNSLNFYTTAGSTLSIGASVSGNITGNVTGNVNSSGVSTITTLRATSIVGVTTAGITTAYIGSVNDGPLSGARNRIINGAFDIWQRGTSFTSLTSSTYTADRWYLNMATPGTGVFRVDRDTSVPSGQPFLYSWKLSPSTAMSSVGAATYVSIFQMIEGFNCADLRYGTSSAKTITISFWVRSNVTGIVPVSIIQNSSAATYERAYPTTYTINAADTWQKVEIVVPGDTSGAIAYDNTWGLQFNLFYMAIGSNYQSGTANTWNTNSAGTQYVASGQTYLNRANSTSNNFYITGVQVESGPVASQFERRSYGQELQLCQRYYERDTELCLALPVANQGASSRNSGFYFCKVTKRTTATVNGTGWTFEGHHNATPTISSTSVGARIEYNGGNFRSSGGVIFATYIDFSAEL